MGASNPVLGECLLRAVSAAVPVVAWPNRIVGIIQLLQGSHPLYEGGKISGDLLIFVLFFLLLSHKQYLYRG